MSLRLRDGVSWCSCAGRTVFLDLERDRYVCLSSAADAAFQRWAEAAEPNPDPAALAPLIKCGLLVSGDRRDGASSPASIVPAARDLALQAAGAAGPTDIVRAALAQYRAVRLLHRQALPRVVALLARRDGVPRASPPDAEVRARRLAAAFAAAGMVVRTADRCLPRAIAMRQLCGRAGIHPALVFGVRRDPFAPHCWIQLGDAVLVGDLEQVRLFTPILVVP